MIPIEWAPMVALFGVMLIYLSVLVFAIAWAEQRRKRSR